MAFKFNFPTAPSAPKETRILDPLAPETKSEIAAEVHRIDQEINATDAFLASQTTPQIPITEERKLSKLVDEDFPFDDSQLEAIEGVFAEQYGVLIGAAGTGKTTVTKAGVDKIQDTFDVEVNLAEYWRAGFQPEDPDDDYEATESLVPAVVCVSFTGRATQQTKRNFPRDWHSNIMTIHRMLGFRPVFFEVYDAENDRMKNTMRFEPSYNGENKLPWKTIIIDEAGMLGLDLWHQLWAACEPDTQIIMIGDINQLPPTHGKSVLGFAMANWPTWELTHVHRQQGSNNSIVDNAHRILHGLPPKSDCPDRTADWKSQKGLINSLNWMTRDPDWRYAEFDIDEDPRKAAFFVRNGLKLLQNVKFYDPNRDAVITTINGFESTATGFTLGQDPMNRELVLMLNKGATRNWIDAGRERKNFALGDKVMATKNDYEAGITNGMTGIIQSIERNGDYQGDIHRWGPIDEVNRYLSDEGLEEDEAEFTMEEMLDDANAGQAEADKRLGRGPASHIVTVRFGEGDHAFEIPFGTQGEVESLILAYVMTCHKMQGGEAPVVFVILHQSHKRQLNREWWYTAVTRGSLRVIVLKTRQAVGFALAKQNIKGRNLAEKVKAFQDWQRQGPLGATVNVKMPRPVHNRQLVLHESTELAIKRPNQLLALKPKPQTPLHSSEASEARRAGEKMAEPQVERIVIVEREIHHFHTVTAPPSETQREVKDGGELTPHPTEGPASPGRTPLASLAESPSLSTPLGDRANGTRILALPATAQSEQSELIPQIGAVLALRRIEDSLRQKLLPKPAAPVEPAEPYRPSVLKLSFAGLIKQQQQRKAAQ